MYGKNLPERIHSEVMVKGFFRVTASPGKGLENLGIDFSPGIDFSHGRTNILKKIF